MRNRLFLLLFPMMMASCGLSPSSGKTLVASFYPIAYVASEIAGDNYEVKCLVPTGEEPHDFDLRPSGAKALEDASAVFLNGLGMEPWSSSLSPSVKSKTYTLSEGIKTLEIDGRLDPHVWLDPIRYLEMADNCCDALSTIDPDNASVYRGNLQSFALKIEDLMKYCQSLAESFDHKVIAVSHAAFGYMAERFGFTQLYINNVSPSEEPSQKAIEAILDAIKTYGIDTVFFEELASDAVARKIAEATGAKCESLNPLEGLDQKSLDAGEDYFSVYKEDMRKIAEAKP